MKSKLDLLGSKESTDGCLYRGVRIGYGKTSEGYDRGVCLVSFQESVNSPDEVSIVNGEVTENTFDWGNRSSLATRLSRRLLEHYFEDEVPSLLVSKFRDEHVKNFSFDGWVLHERTLRAWLQKVAQEAS
jgi:hypothetical protein